MSRHAGLRLDDLSGAVRLATDATTAVTDLVEAVHARIAAPAGGSSASRRGRTTGISGLVYRSVRGITRMTGEGLASTLQALSKPPQSPGPVTQREAFLAALNGVLGDHLAATGNPLAVSMHLHHRITDGREANVMAAHPAELAQDLESGTSVAVPSGQVLLMIHGLCMHPMHWTRAGHNHGAELARALGFAPRYLHYNSGLQISTNGRALAELLEASLAQAPAPASRLVILGHSMGGLLARSALHHGRQAGHRWPALVTDLICLGTPHHGAPLERIGHRVDTLLGQVPYASPFARIGRLRSAGITDLRHGTVANRRSDATAPHKPVPLPSDVRCFAMAATLSRREAGASGRLLGDGLVPLDSALGRHTDPGRDLSFALKRQWIGTGMGHLDLLSDPRVYAQLLRWLKPAGAQPGI